MPRENDIRNRDTRQNEEYWKFVEETAKEVQGWPSWMRGERDEQVSCPENSRSSKGDHRDSPQSR